MAGIPIDRGWAWCVCLGAFVNLFFVTGGLRSVGLLFIEISEKFGASRTMTSVTVGFLGAGFGIFSPIGNALGMRFTMRKVVFVGGIIGSLSAVFTAFAMNIYYIIVVFGIFTGVAYGLMFGPSLVMIGLYFDKRRSLANGLAAAGGSLGQLVLPILITYLINNFAFSGCMLIIGGLTFHALPASLLFRPFTAYRTKSPEPEPVTASGNADIENGSLHGSVPKLVLKEINHHTEITGVEIQLNNNEKHDSNGGLRANKIETNTELFDDTNATSHTQEQSIPLIKGGAKSLTNLDYNDVKKLRTSSLSDSTNRLRTDSLCDTVTKTQHALHARHLMSKSKSSLHASSHSIAAFQQVPPSIKKELEKNDTALPVEETANVPTSPSKGFWSFLDFSLFGNALFLIYVVGLTCGHGGYVNLCMFLPAYANEVGVAKDQVALLLSIIGLSDLFGRILGGWFADLGLLKRSNIMAICLSFTGICAIIMPFKPIFPVLATLSVITGLIGGVYVSLMAVVAVDFLGISRLASGFGLAMMFLGLGCIPIPIVIGFIKDTTGTFSPAIRLCGALMAAGGFSFALEPIARRIQAQRKN